MKEEQPFGLGSEGNIQSEHKMDILGNAKQILHTEEEFSSHLLYWAFALLLGISTRFWSRDIKYLHVVAQEVIFPLRDLAREKLKSFEEWSVNRRSSRMWVPLEEKPASFNKQVGEHWLLCERDTPSSLHESFLAGSKVWGLNEVKEQRGWHTQKPNLEAGGVRGHFNLSLLLMSRPCSKARTPELGFIPSYLRSPFGLSEKGSLPDDCCIK